MDSPNAPLHVAYPNTSFAVACELLKECAEHLECVPETAAGGSDDSVNLARKVRAFLKMMRR